MADNVTALKTLYVAMGGSAGTVANVSTIADMITAIAALIPSGGYTGKELPTVSSTNNGQVLTVVSGKWKNADLPS